MSNPLTAPELHTLAEEFRWEAEQEPLAICDYHGRWLEWIHDDAAV